MKNILVRNDITYLEELDVERRILSGTSDATFEDAAA